MNNIFSNKSFVTRFGGPAKVTKDPAKKKPKTKKPFYVGKKPILTEAQKRKQAENAKNKG